MTKLMLLCALFAVFLAVIPSSTAEDRPENTEECLKVSGATDAAVFARPRQDSTEIRCFWKCMCEKKAVLVDGNLNVAIFDKSFPKAISHLKPEQVDELKKCLSGIGKIEKCDDMIKIRTCIENAGKN